MAAARSQRAQRGTRWAQCMNAQTFWRSVFPPIENPTLRVLSHGGGVQTSTLLFMAERGEIDPIDAAIIGDTDDEPKEVWEYLEYARSLTRVPIYRVSNGSLTEHIIRSKGPADGKQIVTLPYYLSDGGQMMRTCTKTLKIDAVTKEVRRLLGLSRGQRVPKGIQVEVLIGISADEKWRAGGFPAEKWQSVRYPLLEADMALASCIRWLEERQYRRPPRSRCRKCPYRSNESWRALSPEDFEHACQFDDFIREGGPPRGFQSLPYLHRDRIPLREVDLTREDLFPEEDCTGGCGT